MALEFMKRKYPIQKSEVGFVLEVNLTPTVFNYAIDHYQLPSHSLDDRERVLELFDLSFDVKFAKDIFAHPKVASKFVKWLEAYLVEDGRNSFLATCEDVAGKGLLQYKVETGNRLSTFDKLINDQLVKTFNPLLDRWANDAALLMIDLFEEQKRMKTEALGLIKTGRRF